MGTKITLVARTWLANKALQILDEYADGNQTIQLEQEDCIRVVLLMQELIEVDGIDKKELDRRRHTLLRCLFGKTSTKHLYYCERDAFFEWYYEDQDLARGVCLAVIEEDAMLKGQTVMDFMGQTAINPGNTARLPGL